MPIILLNSRYHAKRLAFVKVFQSKPCVFEDPQKHSLGQILASVHRNDDCLSLRMFQYQVGPCLATLYVAMPEKEREELPSTDHSFYRD